MNTNQTSTTAGSSVRSRATRRTHRRPSKLALLRVKVATIIAAIILFLASLAGIAIYNPGVATQVAQPAPTQPAQHITILKPNGSGTQVLQPPPRVTTARPFVRSRGS